MSTAAQRQAWKRDERKVLAAFGSTRKPVSGRQHDKDGDDGEHPHIHVQQKRAARHAILALWDRAWSSAQKRGKIPVISLTEHDRPHFWLLIRDDHVIEIAKHLCLKRLENDVNPAATDAQPKIEERL